jgi:PAS domain-containing protein
VSDKEYGMARMMEALDEGVIMTDKQGEVILANQMAREILGFDSNEELTSHS